MTQGIDISQWQTRKFPLEDLYGKYEFCYLRCYGRGRSGVGRDPLYINYQKRAKKAGYLIGTYSALYPDIPIKEQVIQTYDALVKGHGFEDRLPLALDVELKGLKMEMVWAWVNEMLDVYETDLAIYTAPYFWRNISKGQDLRWIEDYGIKLWIAHWGAPSPIVPRPWTDWYIWQVNSSGKVGGIRYDRNVARALP
jgi:GH25 family lysozyme M1 (1,4-beta-N-acetylmuramidase)